MATVIRIFSVDAKCEYSACRFLHIKKGQDADKMMTAQKSTGVSGRGCMPLCQAFLNRPHLCALTGLSHKP